MRLINPELSKRKITKCWHGKSGVPMDFSANRGLHFVCPTSNPDPYRIWPIGLVAVHPHHPTSCDVGEMRAMLVSGSVGRVSAECWRNVAHLVHRRHRTPTHARRGRHVSVVGNPTRTLTLPSKNRRLPLQKQRKRVLLLKIWADCQNP